MARAVLIAGNWKMNGRLAEGIALAQEIAARSLGKGCELLICPPATLVHAVGQEIADSPVLLGGQDCHAAEKGAHTGDVSAAMLADLGASHVILGHSERRADHGETNQHVAEKASAAWSAGLCAIVCVGETEAEREAGDTLSVVSGQLSGSVPDGATAKNTVIAYEPVWAIGTGKTATPDDAQAVHAHIRGELVSRFGENVGAGIRILYGGSMKPGNAADLLAKPDIDGGLIGGASLKYQDFLAIADAVPTE